MRNKSAIVNGRPERAAPVQFQNATRKHGIVELRTRALVAEACAKLSGWNRERWRAIKVYRQALDRTRDRLARTLSPTAPLPERMTPRHARAYGLADWIKHNGSRPDRVADMCGAPLPALHHHPSNANGIPRMPSPAALTGYPMRLRLVRNLESNQARRLTRAEKRKLRAAKHRNK